MQLAQDSYRDAISRARLLGSLHSALALRVTTALDVSDLLRAQIVLGVSALDYYIHEITVRGMLQIYDGSRAPTPAFSRYKVSMDVALSNTSRAINRTRFESEIRERHSLLSFQQPEKIADAIRLITPVELWKRVAQHLALPEKQIKDDLSLIVTRRNKIAHEADIDPSYPGAKMRWPITPTDVASSLAFIDKLCETIHIVVV